MQKLFGAFRSKAAPAADIKQNAPIAGNLPGLQHQVVPEDENRLFNAICLYIGQDASFIRSIVAANLENNQEEYASMLAQLGSNKTVPEYIDAILAGVQGGNLELAILMKLLDRPILVVHPDKRIEHGDKVNDYADDVIFVSFDGKNYSALIKTSNLTGREIFKQLQQLDSVVSQPEANKVSPKRRNAMTEAAVSFLGFGNVSPGHDSSSETKKSPSLIALESVAELKNLRETFKHLENVLHVASNLILNNPRFLDAMYNKPHAETFWTPDTLITEKDVYAYQLQQELDDGDESIAGERTASLLEFVGWANEYRLIQETDFSQLAQDIEDGEPELAVSFMKWVNKINFLCSLKDKILCHYVISEGSNYPLSLIPLEKFRYFYRELTELSQLRHSFEAWLKVQTKDDVDSIMDSDWFVSLDAFNSAVKLLIAMTMSVSVVLLSMKKDLEQAKKTKEMLLPSFNFRVPESKESGEKLSDVQLEERIVSHKEAIENLQMHIEDLNQNSAAYIKKKRHEVRDAYKKTANELAEKLATCEERINRVNADYHELLREGVRSELKLEQATLFKVLEEHNQKLHDEPELQAWLESEEGVTAYISGEVENSRQEIAQHQRSIATCQHEIDYRRDQALAKQRRISTDGLKQKAEAAASYTWSEHYAHAVKFFVEYITAQQQGAASVLPEEMEYPASDIVLMHAMFASAGNEYKQDLLDTPMQVRKCRKVSENADTLSFSVVFEDSEHQLLHRIHLDPATCKLESMANEIEILSDNVSQKIIDLFKEWYRANYGETPYDIDTRRVLEQLASVSRVEEIDVVVSSTRASMVERMRGAKKSDSAKESVVRRNMDATQELALYRLICATSTSEKLVKIIIEQTSKYDLSADSPIVRQWLRSEYQNLFLQLAGETVSEEYDELPLFDDAQSEAIISGNWLLMLSYFPEMIHKDCYFNTALQAARVTSIVNILYNMLRHLNQLPGWITDFFESMDNTEHKENIDILTDVVKVKLAFSLVIEFVCDVLTQAEFFNPSRLLRKMQEKFNLPSLEAYRKHNIIELAVFFISKHAKILLQGTNFEITSVATPPLFQQAAMVELATSGASCLTSAHQTKSTASAFKSFVTHRVTGARLKDKPLTEKDRQEGIKKISLPFVVKSQEDGSQAIKTIDIQEENIILNVQEDVFSTYLEHPKIMGLVDEVGQSVVEHEQSLGEMFLANHKAPDEDDEEEAEDIYRKLFHEEKSRQSIVEMNRVTPKLEDYPDLKEAVNTTQLVSKVLRTLVLESDDDIESSISSFQQSAIEGIEDWIKQVKPLYAIGETMLNVTDVDSDTFFAKQLEGLQVFNQMFKNIELLVQKNSTGMAFLLVQNKSTVSHFVKHLARFNAAVMMVCVIVLAQKREIFDAKQLVNVLTKQSESESLSVFIGHEEAWSAYDHGVEFLTRCMKTREHGIDETVKLIRNIPAFLPSLKVSLVQKWIEQYKDSIMDNKTVVDFLVGAMELKKQGITVLVQSVNERLIVSLQTKNKHSIYGLHVRPEFINPLYSMMHYLAKVKKGRAVLSILKAVDLYDEQIAKLTAVLPIGAMDEREQLVSADKRLTRQDSFELEGFLGGLYLTKTQSLLSSSRMANALATFAREELGLNLQEFAQIYTKRSEAMGYELCAVQMALTMMVVKLHNSLTFQGERFSLTNYQLRFAVQGYGYLEVLHVGAVIKGLDIDINNGYQLNKLLFVIAWLNENFSNLPAIMTSFLESSKSQAVKEGAQSLGIEQKITMAFILVVKQYQEIFATLKLIGEYAEKFKKLDELFTRILRDFLPSKKHDDLTYTLAKAFSEHNTFFDEESGYITVAKTPVLTSSGVETRVMKDSSQISATERGFVILRPAQNAVQQAILLRESVGFFASIKVSGPAAMVLASLAKK